MVVLAIKNPMTRPIQLLVLITAFFSSTVRAQDRDSVERSATGADVTITAERPMSAASDKSFLAKKFEMAPRNSTQDLLRIVPGLIIAQHAGGGKAEQIFLRGFDADHGTDVNITVDDVPVNMISHGHGQGYADLHFIIPETIGSIDVVKGPYFARFGDLATAGAVTFHTRDSIERNVLALEGGQFNTYRGFAMLGDPVRITGLKYYAAAEVFGTRGYFDAPQDMQRYNVFAKAIAPLESCSITASLMSFASSWDASGQIPQRVVPVIGRFGAVDDGEGGNTSRSTAMLKYETAGADPFNVTASLTKYNFKLFSDFTFFARDSVRGDMIEQNDNRTVLAFKAEKRATWSLSDNVIMQTRAGLNARADNIHVALFEDSARLRHATTVDAEISQRQFGSYVEQEILLPFATLQFGARADHINFHVSDLNANGATGQAEQFVISPKANLSIPLGAASIFANSGFGFHSNDARAVVLDKSASLPRAFGSELGMRYGNSRDIFSASAAAWMLDLDEELVYVGDEGTTERSGRTRRQGIDLELSVHPWDWLTINSSLTLSKGRYRDLAEGENMIPLAPDRTLTGSAIVDLEPLVFAMHMRHIGDRPANEDGSVTALGYTVLDLTTHYDLGSYRIFASMNNLFDVDWNEAQFDTESRLRGESGPVSELHFTPGTPRDLRLGVSYSF
jgi:outer membrane receptor protein involved in Fe transport